MKKLLILLPLVACTPQDTQGQFESICANIRSARLIIGDTMSPKVKSAFDGADTICVTKPHDVASAIITVAALYVVISKAQREM